MGLSTFDGVRTLQCSRDGRPPFVTDRNVTKPGRGFISHDHRIRWRKSLMRKPALGTSVPYIATENDVDGIHVRTGRVETWKEFTILWSTDGHAVTTKRCWSLGRERPLMQSSRHLILVSTRLAVHHNQRWRSRSLVGSHACG